MNEVDSRRKFLKKAAYVAPMILALGAMTAPVTAHASVIFTKGTWYDEGSDFQFEAGQNYNNVDKAIENGYLSYDRENGTYKTTDKFSKLDFSTDSELRGLFNGLFNNPQGV